MIEMKCATEGFVNCSAEVDGRIILKWIFKTWDGGMDWIELTEDRDRWRALVNAAMSLRVP
jgi:hypothetical protein